MIKYPVFRPTLYGYCSEFALGFETDCVSEVILFLHKVAMQLDSCYMRACL